MKDGRRYNLGRYHDERVAAAAYDEAALKFFGEHARVNFPDGVDASLAAQDPSAAAAAAAAAAA